MFITLHDTYLYNKTDIVEPDELKSIYLISIKIAEWLSKENAFAVSANQIGIKKSFFLVSRKAKNHGLRPGLYINPEYNSLTDKMVVSPEWCLSFPGRRFQILRYPEIEVKYTSSDGIQHTEDLKGTAARIFQHECDHLAGRPDDITARESAEKVKEIMEAQAVGNDK